MRSLGCKKFGVGQRESVGVHTHFDFGVGHSRKNVGFENCL